MSELLLHVHARAKGFNWKGAFYPLSNLQATMLDRLSRGKIISFEQLHSSKDTLKVHIHALNSILEELPFKIICVRNEGYRLERT